MFVSKHHYKNIHSLNRYNQLIYVTEAIFNNDS